MNKLLQRANKRISFGSAATLLVGIALLGQILGFLRSRYISTNFTVGDPGSSDAFFAAFAIPDFFFFTIAAGALGVAFMPVISDRLQAGDREGVWKIASSLINVLAIAMLIIGVIIFVFAKPLIHSLYSSLPPENLDQAVMITRIIALNPLLFTISGILSAVQQTFGRFFFFAMAPLVYNATIIASIFLLKDSLGIVGLGVGALAGAILQLLVSYMGMAGLGFRYTPKIGWKNQHFRSVLKQLPPRSLDQGVDQVNTIVEVNRAVALGTGPASYYNFALTLHNVPIMLIGNSIATAAFPRLIERLSQGRPDLFRKEFLKILRSMIWITAPVAVIAFFCRGYLARLIYGDAAPVVSLIFGFLVVAIIFRIVYAMVSRWFYAQKDTKTPLYVSVFAISLNIYLAFKLARPDSYDVAGLALAQSIVAVAEVAVLGAIMLWRDRKLFHDWYFWDGMWRIVAATGFTIIAGFIMISAFPLLITDVGVFTIGFKLALISIVTFGVHVGVSALFALDEVRPIFDGVKRFILKPLKYY